MLAGQTWGHTFGDGAPELLPRGGLAAVHLPGQKVRLA